MLFKPGKGLPLVEGDYVTITKYGSVQSLHFVPNVGWNAMNKDLYEFGGTTTPYEDYVERVIIDKDNIWAWAPLSSLYEEVHKSLG